MTARPIFIVTGSRRLCIQRVGETGTPYRTKRELHEGHGMTGALWSRRRTGGSSNPDHWRFQPAPRLLNRLPKSRRRGLAAVAGVLVSVPAEEPAAGAADAPVWGSLGEAASSERTSSASASPSRGSSSPLAVRTVSPSSRLERDAEPCAGWPDGAVSSGARRPSRRSAAAAGSRRATATPPVC